MQFCTANLRQQKNNIDFRIDTGKTAYLNVPSRKFYFMRKVAKTGVVTGIILSIILSAIVFIKLSVKPTLTAIDSGFILLTLFCVACTFWIAMKRMHTSHPLKWNHLILTGIIAGLTSGVLISIASYIYTNNINASYLPALLEESKKTWVAENYSASVIAGQSEWTWFKNPFSFALTNFQLFMVTLFFVSLIMATIYYYKNRNSDSYSASARNHQLIH